MHFKKNRSEMRDFFNAPRQSLAGNIFVTFDGTNTKYADTSGRPLHCFFVALYIFVTFFLQIFLYSLIEYLIFIHHFYVHHYFLVFVHVGRVVPYASLIRHVFLYENLKKKCLIQLVVGTDIIW